MKNAFTTEAQRKASMRLRICFVCLFGCCLGASIASAQKKDHSWHPGEFRGLVTGASTASDVMRMLGTPSWQGKPQEVPDESGAEEWTYKIQTPQGLCCDVFFRDSVMDSITLETVEVAQSKAGEFFGGRFKPVKYSLGADPLETGSAPSCEDPKGTLTVLLNSHKGLSLWVNPRGKIKQVTYSATSPVQDCGLGVKK
jgi:hypothetical protein